MNGRFPDNRNPADEQCKHCKKYFHTRGIVAHQRNCPYKSREDTAIGPPGTEDSDDDGGSPTEESPSEGATPPTDGVGDGGTPEEDPPPSDPARTDGSGLGLEGPPETATVEDDQDDVDDTADCPGCGEDLGVTEEELAAMDSPRCAECGTGVSVS